ncbi:hypothetical protein FISHEDRAFT_72904 [Fistulina hepatica ATCC 64428]|nr:hypothetical protein FISHEDRAFT_72904 [Fistulina hepatica ATCC 64428]
MGSVGRTSKKRRAEVEADIDGPSSKKSKRRRSGEHESEGSELGKTENPKKEKSRSKKGEKPSNSTGIQPSEDHAVLDEDAEPAKPRKYPNPKKDASLTEQSRKALDYVYAFHKHHEKWKFNKARQNWLIRNCWSLDEIPDPYSRLLIKYLRSVQGGLREKLMQTCRKHLAVESPPVKPTDCTPETPPQSRKEVRAPASDSKIQERAQALLDALQDSRENPSS